MAITLGPGLPTSQLKINNDSTASRNLDPVLQPDEISQLLPVALKNVNGGISISFPCTLFKHTQKKALAIHTFPNLDGARIENMGRDPAMFNVKIILTNNIFPGVNEDWVAGALFPNGYQTNSANVFEELIKILDDNSEKILVHPVLGNINVHVANYNYDLNAKGPRDGVYVDVELIETISEFTPVSTNLTNPLVLTNAANNLAQAFNFPGNNPPGLSLSQFVGKVNNAIRQAIAYPNNVVNAVNAPFLSVANAGTSISSALITSPAYIANNTLQTIQNTKNSIDNAQITNAVSYDQTTYTAVQSIMSLNNTSSQNAPQFIAKNIAVYDNLQKYYINQNNAKYSTMIVALRAYIYQLQKAYNTLSQNLAGTNKSVTVATYVTQNSMTWMQLARYLNNIPNDLLKLNQSLVGNLWVRTNTTISYYQS